VDAKEVTARFEDQYPNVKLVGIIKEVAPVKGAATDKELGVNEFATEYWNNHELYMNPTRGFYSFLGNKSILSQGPTSWNPISMLQGLKEMTGRYNSASGNLAGEGLLKGGLIIITPEDGGTIVYQHEEHMGSQMNLDEINHILTPLMLPETKYSASGRSNRPPPVAASAAGAKAADAKAGECTANECKFDDDRDDDSKSSHK
jgi:hypothetical protein